MVYASRWSGSMLMWEASARGRGTGDLTGAFRLYVELIGLPGAGKTTVFKDCLPALRAEGLAVLTGNRVYRAGDATDLFRFRSKRAAPGRALGHGMSHLRQPHLAMAVYRFGSTKGATGRYPRRMARSIVTDAWRAKHMCRAVREGNADIIVRHQGCMAYIREIVSLTERSDEEDLISLTGAVLEAIRPAQALFAWLDADPGLAAARIAERGMDWGPYDRMTPERAVGALARQRRTIAQLGTALEKHPGVELRRLDATRSVAELATDLCTTICERLEHGPGARHVRS